MIRFITFIAAILIMISCGGGGSGAGQAGDKSSLRALNAIAETNSSLSISIVSETTQDEDLNSGEEQPALGKVSTQEQTLFAALKSGQSSEYKPVASGLQKIKYFEDSQPAKSSELINEFNTAAPYSLIVYKRNQSLTQILAINDRSDTPQGKIRIRVANVKEGAISLSFIGSIATRTPTAVGIPTLIPAVPQTVVPQALEESDSELVTQTKAGMERNLIAASLATGQISDYSLLDRGDYRIQISDSSGVFYISDPITFNPNQIETIVVTDLSSTLIRLNDKP